MPGTLVAREITKSYGDTVVLDRVSVTVGPGDRLAIVGPNGIGKSTLLRVLAGIDDPEAGDVVRKPPDLVAGYLPQELDARPDEMLLAYLARRTGIAAAQAELDDLASRLGREPGLAERHAEALERFLAIGGTTLSARARAACSEVGLTAPLDRPIEAMSGGEWGRVRLAAILLSQFDVLLLDEPTNDLDFEGLARLERFLDGVRGGVVCVSHDRAFQERTAKRVLEFEAETRRPREYAGGFAEFERRRARERDRDEAAFRRYSEERERFGALLHERRTQARSAGKQANRRSTQAVSSKVRAAERRLERLPSVEKPWEPWRLHFELPQPERSGEVVARLEGAVVERGAFRLGPLDFELSWGERVAIGGRNGSGKTTFLQTLLGKLPLAAGRRRLGPRVRVGELEQRRTAFASEEPVIARFVQASELAPGDARTLLGRFGLRGGAVERPASSLSPGERTRAGLALVQALGVNCLVLDEPTNHLDLEAIEQLEQALTGFPGTIVLVTHDRRFLDVFDPTRVVSLDRPTSPTP